VTGLSVTNIFSPATLNVFSFSGIYDRITAETQHGIHPWFRTQSAAAVPHHWPVANAAHGG
jgi:hypothetical protein